jgi:bifunctional non-homologous end joining protein LigD
MLWKNAKPRVRSARAPEAFIAPPQPTQVDRPPVGDDWAHEIKHDGFRIQIHTGPQGPRIFTFTGADWTDRFAAIATAAASVERSAILDAEACVPGADGVTDFEAIKTDAGKRCAIAYVFDLMALDDEDLRPRPWLERRAMLKRLLGRRSRGIAVNDHVIGNGPAVFAEACRMGLEGIVSKRTAAAYPGGKGKTRSWLKVKNRAASGWTRFRDENGRALSLG